MILSSFLIVSTIPSHNSGIEVNQQQSQVLSSELNFYFNLFPEATKERKVVVHDSENQDFSTKPNM